MIGLLATTIGVVELGGAPPAGAATISVANEAEYRAAVTGLGAATVFDVYTIEITADFTFTTTGSPTSTSTFPLVVNGNGHTVDVAGKAQFLVVADSNPEDGYADLTINDLEILHGAISGAGGKGGAVSVNGALTMADSAIRNSTASTSGGAVWAAGSVVLTRTEITDNVAGDVTLGSGTTFTGGGIAADGVVMTDSLVAGNRSEEGGGVRSGRFGASGSTISGNTAAFTLGRGGGVYATGTTNLVNSTVTGNVAKQVGGILSTGDGLMIFATVAGNTTTTGPANLSASPSGGLANFGSYASVLARPIGGANCAFGGNGQTQSLHAYATDQSCAFTGATDVAGGADPLLGALRDNGGPTPTMLPAPTSPLHDVVPWSTCVQFGTGVDQRGETRPDTTSGSCDIGAVEGVGTPPPPPLAPCLGQDVTVDLGQGQQPTSGSDVIRGTSGADVIDGLGGDDLICAFGGDDHVLGGTGDDHVRGGPGDDTLGGAADDDELHGGVGEDTLTGGAGADVLEGVAAADLLAGGPGDDHLVGGWGTDRCDGGGGIDRRQTCETTVGFP